MAIEPLDRSYRLLDVHADAARRFAMEMRAPADAVRVPVAARTASALRSRLHEQPTSRELAVLELVRAGRRNREIAAVLHVSQDTVKTRLKNVMGKLCASNRTHAVTIATRLGLLDEGADGTGGATVAMRAERAL